MVVCLVLLPAGGGKSLLAAPLLLVVATAPEVSVAATSSEAKVFSDVCLDSVDLSGADLSEALVRVLEAAAVSVSVVTLLGVPLPAAGLLSDFLGAVLLGVDLVGVLLSLSFVVLTAEVSSDEGVVLLEEFNLAGVVLLEEVLAGVVCVFAFPGT